MKHRLIVVLAFAGALLLAADLRAQTNNGSCNGNGHGGYGNGGYSFAEYDGYPYAGHFWYQPGYGFFPYPRPYMGFHRVYYHGVSGYATYWDEDIAKLSAAPSPRPPVPQKVNKVEKK